MGVVLLEALKFMVHLVETDEYRTLPPPAAFAKHNPSLFEILKTPIAGAAWVNKLFKKRKGATSAAGDVLPEADAGVQPDAKRKSKAKGKAKAKAKSKAGLAGDDNIEDKDLVVQDMKMELADCRPKWWLDDLIGCLLHAAKCGLIGQRECRSHLMFEGNEPLTIYHCCLSDVVFDLVSNLFFSGDCSNRRVS